MLSNNLKKRAIQLIIFIAIAILTYLAIQYLPTIIKTLIGDSR